MAFSIWPKKRETLSIGIDLGTDTAKLICLQSTKSGCELISHALIRKNNMHSLSEFLAHPALKRAEVRVAIQDPNIKIQKVSVPVVPREELDQVVAWAFKEAANVPVEEYVIRFHQNLGLGDANHQSITAFALEKKHLSEWLAFIANAGLSRTDAAEPDIQALANAVTYNYDLKEGDRYAVIDIGRAQTQFAVVSSAGIEFFRPFSGVGGDNLSNNLSHDLNISVEEAERFTLEVSNDIECEKKSEVEEVIGRYCAKFCVQAQYAIENYSTPMKDKPITNILLSGGGAKLKGLKEQIQESLHFPTDLIDPFVNLKTSRFSDKEFENSKTLYAVAAGLAL